MSTSNGVIKFKARAKQLNNFSGLIRMRGITPTDIDALIDYNGRAFIYLEGKLKDKKMDKGQLRALESMVNSHTKAGHPSAAIVYWHSIPSDFEVPVDMQFVRAIFCQTKIPNLCRKYYENSQWWEPMTETTTVKSAIDYFEECFKMFGL